MRRLGFGILVTALSLVAVPSIGYCSGNVLFDLGGRQVDDDAEPLEEQGTFGASLYYEGETWPLWLVVSLHGSSDEDRFTDIIFGEVDAKLELGELAVGVAKIWDTHATARPYIGGGLSFLSADLEFTDVSTGIGIDDDDDTVAPYGEGGIFWRIGNRFNLGIGARFVFLAEMDLFGEEGDANYSQFHGLIGWGW